MYLHVTKVYVVLQFFDSNYFVHVKKFGLGGRRNYTNLTFLSLPFVAKGSEQLAIGEYICLQSIWFL